MLVVGLKGLGSLVRETLPATAAEAFSALTCARLPTQSRWAVFPSVDQYSASGGVAPPSTPEQFSLAEIEALPVLPAPIGARHTIAHAEMSVMLFSIQLTCAVTSTCMNCLPRRGVPSIAGRPAGAV